MIPTPRQTPPASSGVFAGAMIALFVSLPVAMSAAGYVATLMISMAQAVDAVVPLLGIVLAVAVIPVSAATFLAVPVAACSLVVYVLSADPFAGLMPAAGPKAASSATRARDASREARERRRRAHRTA